MASFHLAQAYTFGDVVAKDEAVGYRWFRQATAQGHVVAQNNLGNAYRYGKGVERDPVAAYMWFEVAAGRGYELAVRNRASLEAELDATAREEAVRRAKAWRPEPAS